MCYWLASLVTRVWTVSIGLIRHFFGTSVVSWEKKLLDVPLRGSDVAIDCGANVGEVTKILARHGSTVYAFEPNPYAFRVLQDRFARAPHVRCIPKGVSDRDERARLYLHEHVAKDPVYWSTGSSFLAVKSNVRIDTFVEVDLVDLAGFIRQLGGRIRLLKIDVEGLECRILRRLIDEGVMHLIDQVFVETHDDRIPSLRQETEQIRRLVRQKGLHQIDLDWI